MPIIQAKHGKYFIRGNHDLRIGDQGPLLNRMSDAGWQHLGGQSVTVSIAGSTVELFGNELPWFKGAEAYSPNTDGSDSHADFRILLTHSPDQFRWSCNRDFDLVLAGHTHGGQIQFPLIGPIVTPSRYGVAYSHGLFQRGRTTMHVTRGLSCEDPIRLLCRPEIAVIELESGTKS